MSERRRTSEQNRKLHLLLQDLGLMDEKPSLALEFSRGRTERTSQLSQQECRLLIDHLDQFASKTVRSAEIMRRKVFVYCYALGWISPARSPQDHAFNRTVIDNFLLKRGYRKKRLHEYTYEELPKLLNQFEQISKHNEASQHNKKVASMLQELNISVAAKVA
ncbi:hypothetical protein [Tunicatimonas pelagia]|uniref:hypothetical protein n=1 Tax=Tunicatimonas pelagia TaxID=931531 RepID=UPI002665ED24|nr:hypothetical protein [Tunicatimonas pelagia]WKN42204.1 hypothetical protein P0M28_24510 [Tunicatimonas pelagia]WKN45322.1 hypothetical protein P0M28_10160 [Tunicatimonas pelagia]